MEETLRQKQLFLRENILDKGYSTDDFMDLLHSKKGDQGLDLNNWTMRELKLIVKEFISYENNNEAQEDNYIQENKPKIETDEEYEQKCIEQYKEQKKKENQEYGACSIIPKSKLNSNNDNVNIKVNLLTQNINKETGEFIVETYPHKFKVKRSFGDFELVLKYLNEQFNYYVIPQISNKKYGEQYTEEKANKRTRALNKFLESIVEHPTLKHIGMLYDFLAINSVEDFEESKKKYLSKDDSEEKKDEKLNLENIKNLSGKIKVSINKEKEVYFMNIKDNTKLNESIMTKINKSYKNLIQILQSATNKMKEISNLWKLLYDKSLKYYETTYASESYKVMNKIMEDFVISETKRINIMNTNIREYFRFLKNQFHVLNELAGKVENYKDKYNKAMEKLKEDKEKLFKEQDINSWGLNENDLKHKDVFLKNKELAFNRMMPEESKNVLDIKNVYGVYLNSLIDEYERIRLLNGKKNKSNTIKILELFCDDYKFINISFENWKSYLSNKVKDEEINDHVNEYPEFKDNDKNLFNNNNMNKNNQFINNRQAKDQNNFRNINNNYQDNKNIIRQPRRNNNQMNFNNANQNQMNMNINKNNNRMNNQNQNNIRPNNIINNQYVRNNNQFDNNNRFNNNNQQRRNNNQFDNNRFNNNQPRRDNNQFDNNRFNNNQPRRDNNTNIYKGNQNNQFEPNNRNVNNNQLNRNNNAQFNRNRNNQYDMNNNNQNNRNRNQEKNNYEENNYPDFDNNRNQNEKKDIYNEEEEYDFSRDRNDNINIYDF